MFKQDRTNPGDKLAMRPFAKLLWTFIENKHSIYVPSIGTTTQLSTLRGSLLV